METKLRSAIKSVVWRITGVAILAAVTYVYTQNWIQTGLVTLLHHSIFLVVFYLHERAWLWFPTENMLKRSLWKMFTYETLCGNIVLGIISYCVTGDFKQMTYITLTYIGIKHICYVFNEYIWKK
jgi:uncharacterized membrane protein